MLGTLILVDLLGTKGGADLRRTRINADNP
jgi:hypothetical protein